MYGVKEYIRHSNSTQIQVFQLQTEWMRENEMPILFECNWARPIAMRRKSEEFKFEYETNGHAHCQIQWRAQYTTKTRKVNLLCHPECIVLKRHIFLSNQSIFGIWTSNFGYSKNRLLFSTTFITRNFRICENLMCSIILDTGKNVRIQIKIKMKKSLDENMMIFLQLKEDIWCLMCVYLFR